MNDPDFQLVAELPGHAWDEDVDLRAGDGTRLERWGRAVAAMRILGIKDRGTLYAMIKAGEVPARKMRHTTARDNSPYEVDLLACWRYKQAGIASAAR